MQRVPEPELMDLPEEADAYARADFSSVNEAFVTRLLELAGNRPAARALDLGAGPGDIALRIAARRPAWRITACDASAAMLHLAARAIAAAGKDHQIHLLRADAKALPVPDGYFDVVYTNSLLHHVIDPVALWREMRRVLAPNGILFLRDLARPASAADAAALVNQHAGAESPLLQEEFHRSLLAAYTVAEVQQQVTAAGLPPMNVAMVSDRHLDVW